MNLIFIILILDEIFILACFTCLFNISATTLSLNHAPPRPSQSTASGEHNPDPISYDEHSGRHGIDGALHLRFGEFGALGSGLKTIALFIMPKNSSLSFCLLYGPCRLTSVSLDHVPYDWKLIAWAIWTIWVSKLCFYNCKITIWLELAWITTCCNRIKIANSFYPFTSMFNNNIPLSIIFSKITNNYASNLLSYRRIILWSCLFPFPCQSNWRKICLFETISYHSKNVYYLIYFIEHVD